ncbi:MAG TPA: HD family hydrolase [Pyrinomonadaceae bacterium]|nr:HD family hydrolase [Pyrinomonadaceae bacterium]
MPAPREIPNKSSNENGGDVSNRVAVFLFTGSAAFVGSTCRVKVGAMLETLIELQRLKRLDRTGWTLRGLPNGTESVAAHSFGVGVTAMLLADAIRARGLKINSERVLRMALIHDWAETRVGDMPKTATEYFGAEARRKAETGAFTDIVKSLGSGASEYHSLYEDYERRASLEARVVKAADVIDLLVEALALERAGAKGLDEFWDVAHTADFALPPIAQEVVEEVLHSILNARRAIQ